MSLKLLAMGLSLSLLAAGPAAAQSVADADLTTELGISVEGKVIDESTLQIGLQPGASATRAIRVYSEPSHRLLALVMDPDFASSKEGQQWHSQVSLDGEAEAIAITRLSRAKPRLTMTARPKSDDRIAVWIYGDWPDGTSDDRLIADGLVGNGDFGFTTSLTIDPVSQQFDTNHCCSSSQCTSQCKTCGPRFTCCVVGPPPNCCWIACGWVAACAC